MYFSENGLIQTFRYGVKFGFEYKVEGSCCCDGFKSAFVKMISYHFEIRATFKDIVTEINTAGARSRHLRYQTNAPLENGSPGINVEVAKVKAQNTIQNTSKKETPTTRKNKTRKTMGTSYRRIKRNDSDCVTNTDPNSRSAGGGGNSDHFQRGVKRRRRRGSCSENSTESSSVATPSPKLSSQVTGSGYETVTTNSKVKTNNTVKTATNKGMTNTTTTRHSTPTTITATTTTSLPSITDSRSGMTTNATTSVSSTATGAFIAIPTTNTVIPETLTTTQATITTPTRTAEIKTISTSVTKAVSTAMISIQRLFTTYTENITVTLMNTTLILSTKQDTSKSTKTSLKQVTAESSLKTSLLSSNKSLTTLSNHTQKNTGIPTMIRNIFQTTTAETIATVPFQSMTNDTETTTSVKTPITKSLPPATYIETVTMSKIAPAVAATNNQRASRRLGFFENTAMVTTVMSVVGVASMGVCCITIYSVVSRKCQKRYSILNIWSL